MSSGGLFSFRPELGETPETLERRRKVAEAMLASAVGSPATTIGGGLAALGQAIGGRLALGRANRGIAAGQAGAAADFSTLFGGGAAAPGETAALPGTEPVSGAMPTAGGVALAGANTGLPDVARMEEEIRRVAPKYGIDPEVAVNLAKHEGLQPGTWQSNIYSGGEREPSYGPFQLNSRGLGAGFKGNLTDPNTWQAQIDFALKNAAKQGWKPWMGRGPAGIGEWEGITRGGAPAVTAALTGTEPVASADPSALAAADMGGKGFDFSPFATGGAAARSDSFSGLQPAMSSGLGAMISSAPADIQAELKVLSGFRSPETQETLWRNAVKKYGSESAARKWVAPPGRSQHGFGNAIDWKFGSQRARDWVHKNAAQYGFSFPLGNEPWHMEVAGARGSRGGPPVRQPVDNVGGQPAIVSGQMSGGFPAIMEALTGAGPQQEAVAATAAPDTRAILEAGGFIDPAAKDDLISENIPDTAFRPAGGPTPYSAGNTVLGGGSANAGTLTPVPDPNMRPAIAPEAPPVAPAAPAATGVAPVARALGVDPLPQTSGLVGPVASAGHESLSPSAQAVSQALGGGGGTNALAGGGGRGLLGRLFGGGTGTPAAGAGGGGGVPSTAATGVAGAGGGYSPQAMAAIKALSNPWLDEGQRKVAATILDNEIAQADPLHQAQLAKARYDLAVAQAKDPVDLAKAKLDYDQALHPELVPPTQAEAAQIERSQAQTDLDKQQQALARERLDFDIKQGKLTGEIKNYDAYSADEKAAGREPLGRLNYELALKAAGVPPNIGTIPPDHVLRVDRATGDMRLEVIPGSPTDKEQKAAEATAASGAEGKSEQADVVLGTIGRLREDVKNQTWYDPITGFTGARAANFEGTAAFNARELVKSLDASMAFDRLDQMRRESKTGGALGAITEKELDLLKSSIASLNPDQGKEQFFENLAIVEDRYKRIMEKANAYKDANKYGFGDKKVPAPETPTTANPDDPLDLFKILKIPGK